MMYLQNVFSNFVKTLMEEITERLLTILKKPQKESNKY